VAGQGGEREAGQVAVRRQVDRVRAFGQVFGQGRPDQAAQLRGLFGGFVLQVALVGRLERRSPAADGLAPQVHGQVDGFGGAQFDTANFAFGR
jgi:hypothetical protein